MNLMTIIIALIVFGVIVTVHEMGHFFTAKYFGVTRKNIVEILNRNI